MLNMSPESIINAAKELGVLLFQENGVLKYFGKLPSNWIDIVRDWVPYQPDVVAYLKNPPWAHRVLLAKAAAEMSRRQSLPCIHLGPLIEAKPACGCGARHHCGKHGECVLSGATNRWPVCSRCPDYSSGVN